jgi:hypothetical protein
MKGWTALAILALFAGGFASLCIAAFLHSPITGFSVLGTCSIGMAIICIALTTPKEIRHE